MVSTMIIFDMEEEAKINSLKEKWALNKYETIRKIVREFEEKSDGNI